MKKPTTKKLTPQERIDSIRKLLPKWQRRMRDLDCSKPQIFAPPSGGIYTCRRELLEALGLTEEEARE